MNYEQLITVLEALENCNQARFVKAEDLTDPMATQIWEIGTIWISFNQEHIFCIGLNEKDANGEHIIIWSKK